jgi:hypothetical protein
MSALIPTERLANVRLPFPSFPDLNSVRFLGGSNDVNGSHGHAFKGTHNTILLLYLIAAHRMAQFPHLPLFMVP